MIFSSKLLESLIIPGWSQITLKDGLDRTGHIHGAGSRNKRTVQSQGATASGVVIARVHEFEITAGFSLHWLRTTERTVLPTLLLLITSSAIPSNRCPSRQIELERDSCGQDYSKPSLSFLFLAHNNDSRRQIYGARGPIGPKKSRNKEELPYPFLRMSVTMIEKRSQNDFSDAFLWMSIVSFFPFNSRHHFDFNPPHLFCCQILVHSRTQAPSRHGSGTNARETAKKSKSAPFGVFSSLFSSLRIIAWRWRRCLLMRFGGFWREEMIISHSRKKTRL